MRDQKGFAFIPLLLANWQLIAIGLLALSVFAYYKHCEYVKKDHREFVAKLEAKAEQAETRAREKESQDKKLKERTDANYRSNLARLERDNKRLRDSAPSRFLPGPAPGAPSPDRATVSRSVIDGALRDFEAEVAGLVAEGDRAVTGLDAAKSWAQGR